MATIRMALSVGAALIVLMAGVPATSQAQAIKTPLQLVPRPDHSVALTRVNSVQHVPVPVPAPHVRRAEPAPQVLAHGGDDDNDGNDDNVMRDGTSVSLVGRLPWWRNDRMQDVSYGSPEAQSKVLTAADAWLAAHGGKATAEDVAEAAPEETFDVADPGEVNEIDLAAGPPPSPTFLQSLMALLGGAAAAAAATVRLLFV